MKHVLSYLAILLVFLGGSMVFDEHVIGWNGFLPVRPLDVTAVENPVWAANAADDAPETLWVGPRGRGATVSVEFDEPVFLSGVWTDTGNSFRHHPLKYTMRLIFSPLEIGEKVETEAEILFSVWRSYRFEPRMVKRLSIECSVAGDHTAPNWALRDVRFQAPGSFHFDLDAWRTSLRKLALPGALAFLWWFLVGRLASRRGPSRRIESARGA